MTHRRKSPNELVQEYQIEYWFGCNHISTTAWKEVQTAVKDNETVQEILVLPIPEGADSARVNLRHILKPSGEVIR